MAVEQVQADGKNVRVELQGPEASSAVHSIAKAFCSASAVVRPRYKHHDRG
jgi:hypothetical protein